MLYTKNVELNKQHTQNLAMFRACSGVKNVCFYLLALRVTLEKSS